MTNVRIEIEKVAMSDHVEWKVTRTVDGIADDIYEWCRDWQDVLDVLTKWGK